MLNVSLANSGKDFQEVKFKILLAKFKCTFNKMDYISGHISNAKLTLYHTQKCTAVIVEMVLCDIWSIWVRGMYIHALWEPFIFPWKKLLDICSAYSQLKLFLTTIENSIMSAVNGDFFKPHKHLLKLQYLKSRYQPQISMDKCSSSL